MKFTKTDLSKSEVFVMFEHNAVLWVSNGHWAVHLVLVDTAQAALMREAWKTQTGEPVASLLKKGTQVRFPGFCPFANELRDPLPQNSWRRTNLLLESNGSYFRLYVPTIPEHTGAAFFNDAYLVVLGDPETLYADNPDRGPFYENAVAGESQFVLMPAENLGKILKTASQNLTQALANGR